MPRSVRQTNKQQEMVSLIPKDERRPLQPPPPRSKPPPSSSSSSNGAARRFFSSDQSDRSEKSTRSGGKIKKRSTKQQQQLQQNDEEKVSLLGQDGRPTPAPNERHKKKKMKSNGIDAILENWSFSRLIRYLGLTCCSAIITFFLLRKESRDVWQDYQHVLDPKIARHEQRCFCDANCQRQITNSIEHDQRCSCPDPSSPLPRDDILWKKHHDAMYYDAVHAPSNLDIVFLGDSIIERWNGTRHMGTHQLEGYRQVFERRFTKKGGGTLEGLALGSSGDTGPNVLWHLKNGILAPLRPKVWFIVIGSNDLFEMDCTDRFVVANILNVLKAIYDQQPDAQFILHGILPRKDKESSKSEFLGQVWKHAQAVNLQLKKFCNRKANMHYMQAGPLFMEETEIRGRRQFDKTKMSDGIHPTKEGLEVWGDYIVKEVTEILKDAQEAKAADEEVA